MVEPIFPINCDNLARSLKISAAKYRISSLSKTAECISHTFRTEIECGQLSRKFCNTYRGNSFGYSCPLASNLASVVIFSFSTFMKGNLLSSPYLRFSEVFFV